eukprot:GHVU01188667.1.p1 GENE.GHVU01188667.1~~GHVU01188667.1.p1  ORF type:complete len:170 (-),score=2.65 GHVU01188667.1:56-565(-)
MQVLINEFTVKDFEGNKIDSLTITKVGVDLGPTSVKQRGKRELQHEWVAIQKMNFGFSAIICFPSIICFPNMSDAIQRSRDAIQRSSDPENRGARRGCNNYFSPWHFAGSDGCLRRRPPIRRCGRLRDKSEHFFADKSDHFFGRLSGTLTSNFFHQICSGGRNSCRVRV